MKVKVYAKLNLTLNVGARQGEFHPIDSVATSVSLYDVVEVTPRADKKVCVTGVHDVEQSHNTAYKAACAFVEEFGVNGVDISVSKGIPFSSGLGGSSADAAAVIYCMCKLNGIDAQCDKAHSICARVGSDVTFMLRGGLGRLLGKGDDVTFYKLGSPLYFVVVTFNCGMSSKQVYDAFDSVQPHFRAAYNNLKLISLLTQGANDQALAYLSNDLQPATQSLSNYAEQYLQFAKKNGLSTVMTGSGSAYYVAFTTLADAQKAKSLLDNNGFTAMFCESVPFGIIELKF